MPDFSPERCWCALVARAAARGTGYIVALPCSLGVFVAVRGRSGPSSGGSWSLSQRADLGGDVGCWWSDVDFEDFCML